MITETDRARFIAPLPEKPDKVMASPLMMERSTYVANEIPTAPSDLRFQSAGKSMAEVRAAFEANAGNIYGAQNPSGTGWILREVIEEAGKIVGDSELMNFSAAVYVLVTPYDRPMKLDRGIHLENPEILVRPMAGMRQLNVVMGNPLPTIALDITPKKAKYTVHGRGISYNKAGDLADKLIVPQPGQYMALQELTPHATPRISLEIESFEDAQRVFADRPETLRWFRKDSYTRLFATAFARMRL